jgi:hypothetical protein
MFITFWIFNCTYTVVFRSPFSGFPPVDGFRPGALEPFVLGTFYNLWPFLDLHFEVNFSLLFQRSRLKRRLCFRLPVLASSIAVPSARDLS